MSYATLLQACIWQDLIKTGCGFGWLLNRFLPQKVQVGTALSIEIDSLN